MNIFIGVIIPFIGTALGSAMVLAMKKDINIKLRKLLLGFASGVMVAASVWSLLIPSIEQAEQNGDKAAWFPAAVGFLAGIGFLLLLDTITPHMHTNKNQAEGLPSKAKKNTMLVLAVTLHNIPEGMAVGVVFAGMLADNGNISLAAAMSLSIGIALQNFPEGAIVSMPLKTEGNSKQKAFLLGTLSGAVEPVAAVLTIVLARIMIPVLPYLLAFAAGAMIYVVADELIPEMDEGGHSNIGMAGLAVGFVLMMILDVALG